MDACWGAYSKTGKPSSNESDYECAGRVGSADFGKGTVTVRTSVSKSTPGGQCVIAVCEDGKCTGAKQFKGVGFDQDAASKYDRTTALVQEDGTGAVQYIPDPNDPQSKALEQAFNGTPQDAQKAFTDSQITDNNKALENINAQLENCAYSAGESTDAGACDTLQQQKNNLEAQNEALKQRSEELKKDIGNISPDPSLDCSTADNANNPRCFSSLTGNKTGGCPTGQINIAGTCKTPNSNLSPGNGPGGGQQPPGQSHGGGLGGFMQSLLGGLLKALGGAMGGAGGMANCTSDQNQYQQQQQQYQQQMQLYNQQLQQYNYQAQIAQMQGYPPPPPPLAPQQPCFNQSSTPQQCTTSPAQPSPTSCQGGMWRPTTQSGNSCISGWQCVPGSGGGAPSAQLSCQPQVADVGMSIAISFSCGNATGSAGQGFDTGNKLSGSATSTIANPPAGATKATFGLQCTNGTIPATDSCSIDISRPSIILVANPKVIPVNASSTIGWVTTGMESCVVSSPDAAEFSAQNALNTSVNGMAITPALTKTAKFILHCTTLGGQTKDATTTVQVGAPEDTDENMNVQTSADGGSVARGSTVSITWSASSTASDAAVSLWLYDEDLDQATALIARDKTFVGTTTWALPAATSTCPADSAFVCASDLVPGRTYRVEASVYTPVDAYLGGYPPANPIEPTYLADGLSGSFTVSQ
jgi:hypothetical protein